MKFWNYGIFMAQVKYVDSSLIWVDAEENNIREINIESHLMLSTHLDFHLISLIWSLWQFSSYLRAAMPVSSEYTDNNANPFLIIPIFYGFLHFKVMWISIFLISGRIYWEIMVVTENRTKYSGPTPPNVYTKLASF